MESREKEDRRGGESLVHFQSVRLMYFVGMITV